MKTHFIDWLSPKAHFNFNSAFIARLGDLVSPTYHVFDKSLSLPQVTNVLHDGCGGRIKRAIMVAQLILKYRHDRIVLLTYDPIFIVFFRLIAFRSFVIEHNTTPEQPRFWKHALWQLMFTRGLKRLALSVGQVNVLTKLKQCVMYIGTPLNNGKFVSSCHDLSADYFLCPSYRSSRVDLDNISPLIRGSALMIKNGTDLNSELFMSNEIIVRRVGDIDFESESYNIRAILISSPNSIRLSGWIQEGIERNIPLIACNSFVDSAIAENFPSFSFVRLDDIARFCRNGKKSDCKKRYEEKIDEHNRLFRERVISAFNCDD